MRLTCPNCDAKYEVPDDAIPEGGRDVQCSNCGHGWFQMRPEAEIAAEEEAALFGDDLPAPAAAEAPAEDAVAAVVRAVAAAEVFPEAPVEPAIAEGPVPEEAPVAAASAAAPDDTDAALAALLKEAVAAPVAAATPEAEPAPAGAPPRRELDDSVLSILREEAEREEEARRHEARKVGAMQAEADSQMQVQPDLGVDATTPAAALTATQRRLAMLKGEDPDAPPPEPPRPAARRDLLPDVEEINSTLQPGEGMDPDAEIDALPDLTRGRSSFRSGFFLVFLLFIVAAVVYLAAQRLAAQFPALESALNGYVAFVDGLRLWLNDLMKSATQAISGGEA
jgi:predicted Zn finger-like uncharacterized protein